MPSKRGKWCGECIPGNGCGIYSNRPKECREYKCMWLQMKKAGLELRPDVGHIIFDKFSEEVICAAQDPDYDLTSRVKKQINFFNNEGYSVGVIKGYRKEIALAKGHKLEEVAKVIDDRSKLHRRLN